LRGGRRDEREEQRRHQEKDADGTKAVRARHGGLFSDEVGDYGTAV
jgi:hypothetical protein